MAKNRKPITTQTQIPVGEWLPLSLYGLLAQTAWLLSCRSALTGLITALCSSKLVQVAYPSICSIDTGTLTALLTWPRTLALIAVGQVLFEFTTWLPCRRRDAKAPIASIGFFVSFGLPFNLLTGFVFGWDGLLIWAPVAAFLTAASAAIYGKQIFSMGQAELTALRDGNGLYDPSAKVMAVTAAQNYEVALLQVFSNIALAVTITLSIGLAAGLSNVIGAPAGFAAVRLYGGVFVVFLFGFAYFFLLQSGAAARITEVLRILVSGHRGPTVGELPTPRRTKPRKRRS